MVTDSRQVNAAHPIMIVREQGWREDGSEWTASRACSGLLPLLVTHPTREQAGEIFVCRGAA